MCHRTFFTVLFLSGVSAFAQTTAIPIHSSTTNLPPVGLASSETLQLQRGHHFTRARVHHGSGAVVHGFDIVLQR